MFKVLSICLVAVLLLCEAHIKLFYSPWNLPIRNAPGRTSDGTFSAAANSPCGGQNDWGRRNQQRYTYVVDGQRVCTRVNWNGGHWTTKNENYLKALFRCNRPERREDFLQLDPVNLVDGTVPPPDASGYQVPAPLTNALWDGYMMCIDLPFQGITSDISINDIRRQCTFAIVEGNYWGGCIDLMVSANGTVPMYQPPPLPTDAQMQELNEIPIDLTGSEGTYQITNCASDSGGRCCLTGYFAVRKNGAISARFYGNSGFGTCFWLSYQYLDYQSIFKRSKFGSDIYRTNIYLYMGYDSFYRPVTTQNISVTLKVGGTITLQNVGLDIPIVADHDVVKFSSLRDGLNLNYVPNPNLTEQADNFPYGLVIGCGIAGLLVIYLVGGVIYNRCCCGDGRCHHPHIHNCLVGLGLVHRGRGRRRLQDEKAVDPEERTSVGTSSRVSEGPVRSSQAYTLLLPANWVSAIDPVSGEVYYYNVSTKQTTWERPLF